MSFSLGIIFFNQSASASSEYDDVIKTASHSTMQCGGVSQTENITTNRNSFMKNAESADLTSVKFQASSKVGKPGYKGAVSFSQNSGGKWGVMQIYAVNDDATYTLKSFQDSNGYTHKGIVWQNVQNMYYDTVYTYYSNSAYPEGGCSPRMIESYSTGYQLVRDGVKISNGPGTVYSLGNDEYSLSMYEDNWQFNNATFIAPTGYEGSVISTVDPSEPGVSNYFDDVIQLASSPIVQCAGSSTTLDLSRVRGSFMDTVESVDNSSVKFLANNKLGNSNYKGAVSISKIGQSNYLMQIYAVNADATYTLSSFRDSNGYLHKTVVWENVQNMYYDYVPFYYTNSYYPGGTGCSPAVVNAYGSSYQLVTNGVKTSNGPGTVGELGGNKYYLSMYQDYWLFNTVTFVPPEDYDGKIIKDEEPVLLDYLALGDSYSSGEGDTEKNKAINQKYYRSHTDVNGDSNNGIPREKCHLSTRSYPYLLAGWMQLAKDNSKQWDSIACSGATIYDVNESNKSGYEGQWSGEGNPGLGRLHGLSNKSALQETALNEMIPGRKKQIEFVEKYKPKVITLTMGGNDVGFGDKISSCAGGTGTCDWSDSKKSTLGSQIKNQFDNLVDLYTELKNSGDSDMKIYVAGYPQFITDAEPASCGGNIGFVNLEEREMIVQATDYMNQVIEAASNKVGVRYVDISDALNGGKLCEEGQEYVTGVTNIFGWNGNERQESYHPNDYGHIKIAQKIKEKVNNESLLTYSQYPTSGDSNVVAPMSSNFDNGPASSINTNVIADNRPTKGSTHIISVLPQTLKPSSLVHIEVHSDPVDLGDFTVAADGSLSDNITIPSTLPAGYHTLYITGQSYSDESIEITQTILVTGTDSGDLDDNNVPDSQQPCGAFMQTSGQDEDFDGIDDACDPQITDPILYATRNGDSSLGEDPDKLYLFRNVRASSITGITGDYVDTSTNTDNKEALVASSLDNQTEGIFSKFVMLEDENDPNIKIPTILAKDEAGACFAMQATDYLSPALNPSDPNYQPRGFTKLTQLPGGENCE